jgi:uncharacterized membrane protein
LSVVAVMPISRSGPIDVRASRNAASLLFVVILVTGICLRFINLDRKIYWYDETFTSLELSGYSVDEVRSDILTGRVVTGADLKKYQYPAASRTVLDTVRGLIANEPQLTPAYFVVLRWWSEAFPASDTALRALSALFGVASLGLGFWLCRELFPSERPVAYWCTALMAVSPFDLLYSQEARPYSMWGATVLLASAVLLWSIRKQTVRAWALYALCAALSLYTHLLSLLVIFAHGCFVLLNERLRFTRTLKSFLVAAVVSLFAFAPWPYRGQHGGAGEALFGLLRWTTKWVRSVAILFADFNLRDSTPKALLLPYALLAVGLVFLCAYSLYFLWSRASRRQALFVTALTASTALPLVLLDLLHGSSVSLVTRYLYPSLIGIQISVAYLFSVESSRSASLIRDWTWRSAAALVGLLGLSSCALLVYADEWWNKDPDNYVLSASQVINCAQEPLIVSDSWFVFVLTLAHRLRPDVRYLITVEPNLPDLNALSGQVFIFRPSVHLRRALAAKFHLMPVNVRGDLWRGESSGQTTYSPSASGS